MFLEAWQPRQVMVFGRRFAFVMSLGAHGSFDCRVLESGNLDNGAVVMTNEVAYPPLPQIVFELSFCRPEY